MTQQLGKVTGLVCVLAKGDESIQYHIIMVTWTKCKESFKARSKVNICKYVNFHKLASKLF